MRKQILCLVLLAGLLTLCSAGCGQFGKKDKAEAAPANEVNKKPQASEVEEIVIPVQAELPHRGDISLHFETTSRVEAENRVQVVAEAVGECKKVLVDEGDHVKAGDLLAELDTKEMEATLGQTEVQVRQSRTSYEIAERSLAEGIGSKAERDNAKFAYEQSLASQRMQKVQLEKLSVRAPINGVVTKRNLQLGQLIASGGAIFQIVDPNSFILSINPPEKELARLQIGQAAKVIIDAIGNEEFEAHVRRINPGVDSATGTVKVTLDFDSNTRAKLREAAFARVRLVLETHKEALLVAKDAIVEENARKYLFVVGTPKEAPNATDPTKSDSASADPKRTDSSGEAAPATSIEKAIKAKFTAERMEIETGLEDSNYVEVLSGISDGDHIVTLGQHTLKPGSVITLTDANTEIQQRAELSAEAALQQAKERAAGEAAKKKADGSQS